MSKPIFDRIPASPVDHAEHLLNRLSQDRAGYVLARLALASTADTRKYSRYAKQALELLADGHDTGVLRPPLTDESHLDVQDMIEAFHERNGRYPASAVLFARILDEDPGKGDSWRTLNLQPEELEVR